MAREATGRTGRPTPERQKRERPRDVLGRPQPWDAENALEMEDFDALPLERNHELGVRYFDDGRYFPAHEAWETAWKQARDTPDAEFFKGLSQLGAGFVHLLRGNRHGAFTLLRRGAGRIKRYPGTHHGVDTAGLAGAAETLADAVEEGRVEPGPDALSDRVIPIKSTRP